MTRLVDVLRDVLGPVGSGVFLADWRARAACASAVSDYYTIALRDDPFSAEDGLLGTAFGSESVLRSAMHEAFDQALITDRVGYRFPYHSLRQGLGDFADIFGDVDSVEKLAMSAIARVLVRHGDDAPIELMLALANIFYDEALHLESISLVLGYDQAERPWIAPNRRRAWELIGSAESMLSYVVLQHCLYEGEGCIAAAKAEHALGRLSGTALPVRVASRICREETNHALTGYFWLKQLDDGKADGFFAELARSWVESEGLGDRKTTKGRKRRFPLFLIAEYLRTRNSRHVQQLIRANVRAVISSGELLCRDEDLDEGAAFFGV